MILEHIGEGDDALLCMTNYTACCRSPDTGNSSALGNWLFPNGTRVPSEIANNSVGDQLDIYRTSGQMVVRLHRRRDGEEGLYSCEIPDTFGFIQTIYIEVDSGEWYMYTPVLFSYTVGTLIMQK